MANQKRIAKGFNMVAPFYDFIVFLVFGKTFARLQREVFSFLTQKKHCLIVGGGSGEILELAINAELAKQFFYADLSDRMLLKAKKRAAKYATTSVEFSSDWKDWQHKRFDYIILPFVLDCYQQHEVSEMIQDFKKCLSHDGRILLFDFNQEQNFGYQPSFFKDAFIKLLYWFFKLTAGFESDQLPPFNLIFQAQGFKTETRITAYNEWIQGVVFGLNQQPTNTVK